MHDETHKKIENTYLPISPPLFLSNLIKINKIGIVQKTPDINIINKNVNANRCKNIIATSQRKIQKKLRAQQSFVSPLVPLHIQGIVV
jgi:hypothetical protein